MRFAKDGNLVVLSAANFFARYHNFLIAFVISTFLAGFMSEVMLGWVIAGVSTVVALSLIVMPKVFDRSGTRRVLVVFGLLEMAIVIGLTLAHSAFPAGILFALQGICAYNMFLGLDLLLEAHTTDEKKTGHFRGLFLVLANASVLAATLSIAYILNDHNYNDVFLIAAAAVAPFTMLAASLPSISRVPGMHTSFKVHTFKEIWNRQSLLTTMAAHFLLLVFFSWTIYYLPLYLLEHVGFSGKTTFLLMTLSVVPYLLLEYPIGVIADSYLGEKEIAFAGYIIMAAGTVLISFIGGMALLPWILIILLANIGGAMAEVSTETHFFKHVAVTDLNIISAFRMLRPLSAILAPLIASITLLLVPFQGIFIVFGAFLLLGIPLVLAMTDTR
ncbi:MFS transporter [Candidatus Kaiserbacteria bacterium]|nr:MFS transporter [Candidatus Kaiserbacteria bacterium]